MLFDPKESIDFNGNTGPFIQYTYARIQSLKRKHTAKIIMPVTVAITSNEHEIIKLLTEFPNIIQEHTTNKELLKVTDLLGRETKGTKNEVLFYIYDDGTVEKRIVIE
jgi:arginyl-tRNA synthetase